MNLVNSYGDVPDVQYYEFGSDKILGDLLAKFVIANRISESVNVVGLNYKNSQHLVLRVVHILSQAWGSKIELIWITFQSEFHLDQCLSRLRSLLSEAWLKTEGLAASGITSQLIGLGCNRMTNLNEFIHKDIGPILARIHSNNIVIVVELHAPSNSERVNNNIVKMCYELLKVRVSSSIAVFVLTRFQIGLGSTLRVADVKPDTPPSKEVKLSKVGKANANAQVKRADMQELLIRYGAKLRPLALLSHPANKHIVSFVTQYFDDLPYALTSLEKIDLLTYLQGSALAISPEVISRLQHDNQGTNSKAEVALAAMGAVTLGFNAPQELVRMLRIFDSTEADCTSVVSSQSHLSAALAGSLTSEAATVHWHLGALRSHLDSPELVNLKNHEQIDILLLYAGQILLNVQPSHSKILIETIRQISERYANFVFIQEEGTSQAKLKASRIIYRVGHIYDRLFFPTRTHERRPERRKFYNLSARYLETSDFDTIAEKATILYRKGTAMSHAGETDKAIQLYFDAAVEMYDNYKKQRSQSSSRQAALFSFEFAFYCISQTTDRFPASHRLNEILEDVVISSGLDWSVEKLFETIQFGSTESITPFSFLNSRPHVTVFTVNGDLHTALLIAKDVFNYFGCNVEIRTVTNGKDASTIHDLTSRTKIVIGAPDTPRGMGAEIVKIDPLLEQIYYQKMHEDFSYPVLKRDDNVLTLILCASGINGIMNAWSEIHDEFMNSIHTYEDQQHG